MRDVMLPCSRALIVRGAGSTILLSTRVLKRDGVNTYFNDDNSISTSNCLYVTKDRVVVPFIASTHSYNIAAHHDVACAAHTRQGDDLIERAVNPCGRATCRALPPRPRARGQ